MLSACFFAVRPWSFTTSISPVILGTVFAYKLDSFNCPVLFLTLLTVLLVHASGNLINTYYDFSQGIDLDDERCSDPTLVTQILTPQQVVNLATFTYTSACISLFALLFMSQAKPQHLSILFFGGLTASFCYTGGLFPLKYMCLGDVVILFVFGPLCFIFAFVSQSACFLPLLSNLVYVLPLALNTEAILHANNARDAKLDSNAGIITLAILIGPHLSYYVYIFLLFFPYFFILVLALCKSTFFILPMITLAEAFKLKHSFKSRQLQDLPIETAKLNAYLSTFYCLSCFLMK